MKKLIILASVVIMTVTGCVKTNETIIGNGKVQCNPSELTVKVSQVASFTFSVDSDVVITEEHPLVWRNLGSIDGDEGDIRFELNNEKRNTIDVLGIKPGKVILCAYVDEKQSGSQILGGVKITVTR